MTTLRTIGRSLLLVLALASPSVAHPPPFGSDPCSTFLRKGYCIPGFPEVTNILNYGATGDGTTDDTVKIQSALDLAGPGGTVSLPCGARKYVVSGTLTYYANQTIAGCAVGGVPLATNQGSLLYTATPSISVFRAQTFAGGCTHDSNCVDNVTFRDFAIALDGAATNTVGIDLTNVNNATVEGVFIRGVGAATGTIGVLSSGLGVPAQGGLANQIVNSKFYNLVRGVVVQKGANANAVVGNRMWGGVGAPNVAIRGICNGGACTAADACEVDADCTCGATDCRPSVTGVVVGTQVTLNTLEAPATAGVNLIDVGAGSELVANYCETQTSGAQICFDVNGAGSVVALNTFTIGTAGGNDTGVSLRGDTGASRIIVQSNIFRGAGAARPIAEVAATVSTQILENNYLAGFTTNVTLVGTAVLLRDPIGLSFAQATLPSAAIGSVVGCSDCTNANPCAGGGGAAVARRIGGPAWACN